MTHCLNKTTISFFSDCLDCKYSGLERTDADEPIVKLQSETFYLTHFNLCSEVHAQNHINNILRVHSIVK